MVCFGRGRWQGPLSQIPPRFPLRKKVASAASLPGAHRPHSRSVSLGKVSCELWSWLLPRAVQVEPVIRALAPTPSRTQRSCGYRVGFARPQASPAKLQISVLALERASPKSWLSTHTDLLICPHVPSLQLLRLPAPRPCCNAAPLRARVLLQDASSPPPQRPLAQLPSRRR